MLLRRLLVRSLACDTKPEVRFIRKGREHQTVLCPGVTWALEVEDCLAACGASGCWFLSLAACSCSFAKRCFSSSVSDTCKCGVHLRNEPEQNRLKVKRGAASPPYPVRLRGGRCRCGAVLLPVDRSSTKDVIDLKARRGRTELLPRRDRKKCLMCSSSLTWFPELGWLLGSSDWFPGFEMLMLLLEEGISISLAPHQMNKASWTVATATSAAPA